ncbi:uncharacterized protein LOC119964664 isoform X2 [Scyliorhinus canicula]|uniref:uncharacterized protein LOC119964664 isoform X2 n=1 Tax=Scyliorhinus canicula TaxID=7830 RepID=UPI0018F2ED86|nr:uncharacterized protein LOC119964664 isoform X2 [Scyliorhinus canicula]
MTHNPERIQNMAAVFINRGCKARAQPVTPLAKPLRLPKWSEEVETIPHLRTLLRDNQATSGASHVYKDKLHWYSLTGTNSPREQTPISAFTGDLDAMYYIHGGVGKLVAQQLQDEAKIRVGKNGLQTVDPLQSEHGREESVDSTKECRKCSEFMEDIEMERLDMESNLIPLSMEQQMEKCNVKIIILHPQEPIKTEDESEPCPFDPEVWNQRVEEIKNVGGLHSFTSLSKFVDLHSFMKSSDEVKPCEKPSKQPARTRSKNAKLQGQQLYFLSDDGTTKPSVTIQQIKSQPTKKVTEKTRGMKDVLCHQNCFTTAQTTSSRLRNTKESFHHKKLAQELKSISITNQAKSKMSNTTLLRLTGKALLRSETKVVNEGRRASGQSPWPSIPTSKLAFPPSDTKGPSTVLSEQREVKPGAETSPFINSEKQLDGRPPKLSTQDLEAHETSVQIPEAAPTPAPAPTPTPISSLPLSSVASSVDISSPIENIQSMEDEKMEEPLEHSTNLSPVDSALSIQNDSTFGGENLELDEQMPPDTTLPHEIVETKRSNVSLIDNENEGEDATDT